MVPAKKHASRSFQELLVTILRLVFLIESMISDNFCFCFSHATEDVRFTLFSSVGSRAEIDFLREVIVSKSDDETEDWVWWCNGKVFETHEDK